ncbi:hypothetical protein D3C78_1799760 [compost metagenome]
MLCSFILNRNITFNHKGNLFKTAMIFVGVSFFCYFISYIFIHNRFEQLIRGVETVKLLWFDLDIKYILIVFEATIYTVLSFFMHRLVTFKNTTNSSQKELL